MQIKTILRLISGIVFIIGAGLSVAMLVSAVQFLEWGRVVLYAVCLAVCVEAAVLSLSGIGRKERE